MLPSLILLLQIYPVVLGQIAHNITSDTAHTLDSVSQDAGSSPHSTDGVVSSLTSADFTTSDPTTAPRSQMVSSSSVVVVPSDVTDSTDRNTDRAFTSDTDLSVSNDARSSNYSADSHSPVPTTHSSVDTATDRNFSPSSHESTTVTPSVDHTEQYTGDDVQHSSTSDTYTDNVVHTTITGHTTTVIYRTATGASVLSDHYAGTTDHLTDSTTPSDSRPPDLATDSTAPSTRDSISYDHSSTSVTHSLTDSVHSSLSGTEHSVTTDDHYISSSTTDTTSLDQHITTDHGEVVTTSSSSSSLSDSLGASENSDHTNTDSSENENITSDSTDSSESYDTQATTTSTSEDYYDSTITPAPESISYIESVREETAVTTVHGVTISSIYYITVTESEAVTAYNADANTGHHGLSKKNKRVVIGCVVGIGAPVLLALLGVLYFVFIRSKRTDFIDSSGNVVTAYKTNKVTRAWNMLLGRRVNDEEYESNTPIGGSSSEYSDHEDLDYNNPSGSGLIIDVGDPVQMNRDYSPNSSSNSYGNNSRTQNFNSDEEKYYDEHGNELNAKMY